METWIAISLPYLISLIVLFVEGRIREIADWSLKRIHVGARDGSALQKQAVDLAVYTYRQISFFLTAISCIVFSASSSLITQRPLIGVCGVVAAAGILICWFFIWIRLSATEVEGRAGLKMRLSCLGLVLIPWIVSSAIVFWPKQH